MWVDLMRGIVEIGLEHKLSGLGLLQAEVMEEGCEAVRVLLAVTAARTRTVSHAPLRHAQHLPVLVAEIDPPTPAGGLVGRPYQLSVVPLVLRIDISTDRRIAVVVPIYTDDIDHVATRPPLRLLLAAQRVPAHHRVGEDTE